MPTLTVELDEGTKSFKVETGKRLVLALEDNGIDVSHRCGGYAKCTTCRCDIKEGQSDRMSEAEKDRLEADEAIGEFRLSCQSIVDQDMTVKPLMRVKDMDWDDPGKRPENDVTPEPNWLNNPVMTL